MEQLDIIKTQNLSSLMVTQVVSSLQVIKDSLKLHGFATNQQMALLPMVEAIKGAMKDFALSGINWDSKTIDQVLFGILTQGSAIQRSALAKYTTLECGYYMPCVDVMLVSGGGEKFLKFIQENISMLAGHFGCPVSGDIDSMAYTMLKDYGGFSLIDFNTFFQGAKSGKWRGSRGDFQHVATRGINYEYLTTWLEVFSDMREAAYTAAYDIAKSIAYNSTPEGAGFDIPEFIKAKREKEDARNAMLTIVSDAYSMWYKGLHVIKLEDLATGGSGTFQVPMQKLTESGLNRLYKRAVLDYVFFGNAPEGLDALCDSFDSLQKRKRLVEFETLKSQLKVGDMLRALIYKANPQANPYEVQSAVANQLGAIREAYYDVYLPDCSKTAQVYPGLPFKDYLFQNVLSLYAERFENPIAHIFE